MNNIKYLSVTTNLTGEDHNETNHENILTRVIDFVSYKPSYIVCLMLIIMSIIDYIYQINDLFYTVRNVALIVVILSMWGPDNEKSLQYQKLKSCLNNFDRCYLGTNKNTDYLEVVGIEDDEFPEIEIDSGRVFKIELVGDQI